jgi:hypothetical protein
VSGVINSRARFSKTGLLKKAANVDPPEISELDCQQIHQRPQTCRQPKQGARDKAFKHREGRQSEQSLDWENPARHYSYEAMDYR